MRVAAAAPPTWPQPLRYQGAPRLVRVRSVRLGQFPGGGGAIGTAGTAVSIAGTVGTYAPVLIGLAPIPVVGWVAAAVGVLLTIAGMFSGGPELTHAQREQLEVQRVGGQVDVFIQQIQAARSLSALWQVLVAWQSGYVGGTSSVAVALMLAPSLPGAPLTQSQYAAWLDDQVAASWLSLPTGQTSAQVAATFYYQTQGGTVAHLIFPGNPNATYAVFDMTGFYHYLQLQPEALIAGTQAGVTQSMLVPYNINVRNAILNALRLLGFPFTPGGGAAQLFGITTAPSGPSAATVSAWVTQAYQQLLGRAASSTESAGAVSALLAQQLTPAQFLNALTSSAEFQAAHGTTAAVTPAGTVVTGPDAASTTTGQPLNAYWWQTLLGAPPSAGAVPAGSSPGWDWISSSPWLLALGALGLLLVVSGRR
jgi:hypothetical protein